MTFQDVLTGISTVGFPIMCCVYLLWRGAKQDDYHREQMQQMQQALTSNTKAIDRLSSLVQSALKSIGGKDNE